MRAAGEAAGAVPAGAAVLSDEERLAWLRLIRSDNVGPAGIMAHSPQEMGGQATDRPSQVCMEVAAEETRESPPRLHPTPPGRP